MASDVDLSSVAEIAGDSAEHLARIFRREKGCTVGEYVRRLRVERARRARVGCPPGEHRRRRRGAGR